VLGDQLGEELVAGLGAVAAERLAAGHLVHRRVQRRDDRRRQRLGDVADPQADDAGVGMLRLERLDPRGDIGEEIAALELEIVVVDPCHDDRLDQQTVARSRQ
jgi:hypothetical protein